MVVWVSRDVGYASGQSVAHSDDSELGNRILLEELGYKGDGIVESQKVPSGAKVFLSHCAGEIEEKQEMSNYTTLERGGVFKESADFD